MTIERGELLFTNRNGTRYYGANKDNVAIIEYRIGSIVKLDSDVMTTILNNKQSISITKTKTKTGVSNFANGHASIKERGSGKHIAPLHYTVCGIPQNKQDLFILKFIDNDSLNLCRSNILIYKRTTKVGEYDGISVLRINKLKNDTMEVETHLIYINSHCEDILFDEDIGDYRVLGIVNSDNGDIYAHFQGLSKYGGINITDATAQAYTELVEKLGNVGIPIYGLTRLDGSKLDYTFKNLSFLQRLDTDRRVLAHDLSHLPNVTYSVANYYCCAGVIAGRKVKSLALSLKKYPFSIISNVLTQMNDEIERIRQYSVQDILDDECKFIEFKELYEGITPTRYKVLADRLLKKK